jgi:hypothetical protein
LQGSSNPILTILFYPLTSLQLERRAEDPKYSQPSGTAGDGDVDMADSTTIGRKRARAEDFLD